MENELQVKACLFPHQSSFLFSKVQCRGRPAFPAAFRPVPGVVHSLPRLPQHQNLSLPWVCSERPEETQVLIFQGGGRLWKGDEMLSFRPHAFLPLQNHLLGVDLCPPKGRCVPPDVYVGILTLGTVDCVTRFGKRVLAGVIVKMRSFWSRMGTDPV